MDQEKEEVFETPEVEGDQSKVHDEPHQDKQQPDNPDIDVSSLPEMAFEVFAGKSYTTIRRGDGTRHVKKDGDEEGGVEQETPTSRLLALRAAADELADELEAAAAGAGAAERSPGDVLAELAAEARRLRRDLMEGPFTELDEAGEEGVAGVADFQKVLADLKALAGDEAGAGAAAAAAGAAAAAAAAAAGPGGGGGGAAALELYHNPNVRAGVDLTGLEARLAHLERALGAADMAAPERHGRPGAAGVPSVCAAVRELEALVLCLGSEQLGALEARAQRCAAALRRAQRERASLAAAAAATAGEGGGGGGGGAHAARVAALHEGLARWEGTAAALPALVSRLQTLEALHGQAAGFSQRLARLEGAQDELGTRLAEAAGAVGQMEASLTQNLAAAAENASALEARLAALET